MPSKPKEFRKMKICFSAGGISLLIASVLISSADAQSFPLEFESCRLNVREFVHEGAQGLPIILFNGIPATGGIYRELVQNLAIRIPNPLMVVDLPQTGRSQLTHLRDISETSWTRQRACVNEFLRIQPAHLLLVHDIAGPVVIPLLNGAIKTRGLIILNTILKPSAFEPVLEMKLIAKSKWLAEHMPEWMFLNSLKRLGFDSDRIVPRQRLQELFKEVSFDDGLLKLHFILRGFDLSEPSDALIERGLQHPIPQLVIWGLADPSLGQQLSFLPAPHGPREVVGFSNARHFLMVDYAEETSEKIHEWLVQL